MGVSSWTSTIPIILIYMLKTSSYGKALLTVFLCFLMPAFADEENPCAGKPDDNLKFQERLKNAGPKCREASIKAERCCRDPRFEGCGFKGTGGVPTQLPTEGSYGAAVQQTAKLVKAKNDNRAFADVCRKHQSAASKACLDDDKDWDDYPFRNKKLKELEKCHDAQADQNELEIKKSLETANDSMGDAKWRTNCTGSDSGGAKLEQCTLYNDGMIEGRRVDAKERDELPVKALPIQSGGMKCTGYTDESGDLSTAAHCKGAIYETQITDADGKSKTGLWNSRSGKDFDFDKFNQMGKKDAVENIEDAANFKKVPSVNEDSFNGKPYYSLTRDPAMSSGCEIRGGEMACSESALREIQGTQATIQGYPGTQYTNLRDKDTGQLLTDTKTSQIVTAGPAYYDPYSGVVKVNAYAAPGSSGGPVYFPSQTTIGGVTSDRPVIAGSVSYTHSANTTPGSANQIVYSNNRTTSVPIRSSTPVYKTFSMDEVLVEGGNVFKNPPREGSR